jgi:hypothetical protein
LQEVNKIGAVAEMSEKKMPPASKLQLAVAHGVSMQIR